MKRILLLVLTGSCFLTMSQPAKAISFPGLTSSKATTIETPLNEKLIREFLDLTPRKYFALTGQRMTLSQKISLKLSQQKLKRMIRKGKTVDLVTFSKGVDTSDFNLPGFVLGIVLSLIGVLIAYLIDDSDSSMIKWAWIGAGVQAILILLALIL